MQLAEMLSLASRASATAIPDPVPNLTARVLTSMRTTELLAALTAYQSPILQRSFVRTGTTGLCMGAPRSWPAGGKPSDRSDENIQLINWSPGAHETTRVCS